jgi:hypothetical protein
VFALARLRPGVTARQPEAEGTAAARTTIRPMAANLLFGVGGPPIVHVRGMADEMTARVRPALLVLAAGVVFVLLSACANVANLFLSRGVARQRELTVRAAIGASAGGFRDRRARHPGDALLVAEAAFAVLLVTRLMRGALFGIAPLDPVSFAASPLVLVPVAVLSAAPPALRAASTDPAEALRCGWPPGMAVAR